MLKVGLVADVIDAKLRRLTGFVRDQNCDLPQEMAMAPIV